MQPVRLIKLLAMRQVNIAKILDDKELRSPSLELLAAGNGHFCLNWLESRLLKSRHVGYFREGEVELRKLDKSRYSANIQY
jgi:hypothetical protein